MEPVRLESQPAPAILDGQRCFGSWQQLPLHPSQLQTQAPLLKRAQLLLLPRPRASSKERGSVAITAKDGVPRVTLTSSSASSTATLLNKQPCKERVSLALKRAPLVDSGRTMSTACSTDTQSKTLRSDNDKFEANPKTEQDPTSVNQAKLDQEDNQTQSLFGAGASSNVSQPGPSSPATNASSLSPTSKGGPGQQSGAPLRTHSQKLFYIANLPLPPKGYQPLSPRTQRDANRSTATLGTTSSHLSEQSGQSRPIHRQDSLFSSRQLSTEGLTTGANNIRLGIVSDDDDSDDEALDDDYTLTDISDDEDLYDDDIDDDDDEDNSNSNLGARTDDEWVLISLLETARGRAGSVSTYGDGTMNLGTLLFAKVATPRTKRSNTALLLLYAPLPNRNPLPQPTLLLLGLFHGDTPGGYGYGACAGAGVGYASNSGAGAFYPTGSIASASANGGANATPMIVTSSGKPLLKRLSTTGIITIEQARDSVNKRSQIIFAKKHNSFTDISKRYPRFTNEHVLETIDAPTSTSGTNKLACGSPEGILGKQRSIVGISDINVIAKSHLTTAGACSGPATVGGDCEIQFCTSGQCNLSLSLTKYSLMLNLLFKNLLSKSLINLLKIYKTSRAKFQKLELLVGLVDETPLLLMMTRPVALPKLLSPPLVSSPLSPVANILPTSASPTAIVAPVATPVCSMPLSPNTTRKAMLLSELSELLKESIKIDYNLGKVPRPARVVMRTATTGDQDFDDGFDDYHSKGW